MEPVYVVASTRTPIGAFLGSLSTIPAPSLGGAAIQNLLTKAGLPATKIDALYVGNVISAGVGQHPAKQCAQAGGLPDRVSCVHVNQVCCSAMRAVIMAHQSLSLGDTRASIVIGTENMSLTPRLLHQTRSTQTVGDLRCGLPLEGQDAMIMDGLWDSFQGLHMGSVADKLAREAAISRKEQDDYVLRSFERAIAAWDTGLLDVFEYNGISKDELLGKLIPDKIPTLKPCFSPNGVITAASASALADGAAGLLLATESFVKENGLTPVARILAYGEVVCDPSLFPTSPLGATRNALEKAGLEADDMDLWEVNEAFAMVPLYFMKVLNVPVEKINVLGGAVAVGHPLGCTGVRIVNTLISALKIKGKKVGMATLCNGGGGACALILELV
jgi:acetyl-CoA C-acetyltransferase